MTNDIRWSAAASTRARSIELLIVEDIAQEIFDRAEVLRQASGESEMQIWHLDDAQDQIFAERRQIV